jgi:hypothetical protein
MSNEPVTNNAETNAKQDRFLKAYAATGIITKSARLAEIASSTVYSWRKRDIAFMEEMDTAGLSHTDHLEEQMFDLIDEMHKNRDYKANPTLLIFALNGANPQKYKGLTQVTTDAKDILSEFRKAMRDSRENKDNTPVKMVDPKEESEEKLVIKQASKFLSKFGSLNDTNS